MTAVSRTDVETALKGYVDPYLGQDLVVANCIKQIRTEEGRIEVDVELGFPAAGYRDALIAALHECLATLPGGAEITVRVESKIISHEVQKGLKPLPGVKNIIAVASGKGGVGKSTTAVNLALALSVEGARVGLLDADIYGPSQPRMLGSNERPESPDGKSLLPVISHGIQSMSIGYLIEEETPMVWRGPMVTQALEQLLRDTRWDNLDYLIIDLPPGTGDTQLTLSQKVPVSGAIIVTTPQDIALLDARKGLKMFEKVEVSVLGIVENMSIHICSNCGHEEYIFGAGGGQRMAAQYNVPFLGSLPLDIRIREETDNGQPTVAAEPDSRIAGLYRDIARHASARLSLQAKNYSHKFPSIVIQNN
ncbi:iron-sulfur cluster carrier protein ApbC [Candidatus Contendibacter odensensis]|uniref:Iron-sulfur cluster carrier protein n=1 Tax=Candidatus Contendobacter odensis Run_B_J11 TaxID=1400861 RepID=A0A7U7GB20_9GAMM|nr:iron-sulfur cluster carrier protein ApbC [Candidatus Contendobacter odensis]CDH45139.1 putative ATP-binding protein with nucleotide triphosphate hydrolase domain [Candidatus Contendobacter odensis Run_B_J11]